jgi:hypothetical protein
MCAVQPITRLSANVGVNRSRGIPTRSRQPGVELHVRIEIAAWFLLVEDANRNPLHVPSKVKHLPAELFSNVSEHDRPGIVDLVDSAPETHQPSPTPHLRPQPGFSVLF